LNRGGRLGIPIERKQAKSNDKEGNKTLSHSGSPCPRYTPIKISLSFQPLGSIEILTLAISFVER
jgi:hypothetical protein